MHYTFKILYTIFFIILFPAILNAPCSNINLNKENSTKNLTQPNDAKVDISPMQIFYIIVAVLSFILIILCFVYFYWEWRESRNAILRLQHRRPNIELENRAQHRTYYRPKSKIGPNGERTEICKPEYRRYIKDKRGSELTYKSKNEKTEQSRRQHKHKNKRGDEEKDESEDQQMRIWYTNVAYVSDENMEESVVPTLIHNLPKSAKTSASSWPGLSNRKSSNSGVSTNAIKITHKAEIHATEENDD